MKTIRILIYTDIADFTIEYSSRAGFDVQRFIKTKLEKIANVEITVKSRHFDLTQPTPTPAFTRLTHQLLCPFDELWVFGFGNEDTSKPEYRTFEFDDDEVKNLCEWMKRGGVMVTGDHSQPQFNNNDACPDGADHNEYLARGFPLGHRIPRAKQLRVWKGPPTNCKVPAGEIEKSDTQNTLEKVGSAEDDKLQSDNFPQTLEELPSPPHFLFSYGLDASGQPTRIKYFPDHQHVGRVLIPETYDECWPPRPPAPEFVAFGRDKRFTVNERVYPLVVAYDGDTAGIGRIVADTSFHHFIDNNLKNLDARDDVGKPKPDTALDQVAQFHANLAYWLAPKSLRDGIKRDLLFRTAVHLDVLEAVGNGTASVGKAATSVLVSEFGVANLFRIFAADGGGARRPLPVQLLTFALAGQDAPDGFEAFDGDFFMGSVIGAYHEFFAENGLNPLHLLEDPTPPDVLLGGMDRAFRAMAEGLPDRGGNTSTDDPSGADKPRRKDNEMDSQADNETTTSVCAGTWTSTVRSSGSVVETGEFVITEDAQGGLSGTFDGAPVDQVTCTGNRMIIRRRGGGRPFIYNGPVADTGGGGAIARGTRREERNLAVEQDAAGEAEAKRDAALVDDEWVAVKTGTLLTEK